MLSVQVSPINTAPYGSAALRNPFSTSCTSGSLSLFSLFMLGSPCLFFPGRTLLSFRFGSSNRVLTASRRKPATPRLYHHVLTPYIALATSGLRQFRSGCWG